MREYDDDIRPFVPVVQRLIILVAVIVAVPVVLWTITAFIRTYIGPPHAPNYQHIAILQPADRAADSAPVGAAARYRAGRRRDARPADQRARRPDRNAKPDAKPIAEPNGAAAGHDGFRAGVGSARIASAYGGLARFGNGPTAGANCAGQSRFRGAGSDRGRQ